MLAPAFLSLVPCLRSTSAFRQDAGAGNGVTDASIVSRAGVGLARRVAFNAHRIYSYGQVESYFRELELKEFALIPDDPRDGGLVYGAAREMTDSQSYGCGCFWFRREGA